MLDENSLSLVPSVVTELMVFPGRTYDFECAVCQEQVAVALEWVLSSDVPAGPFRREDLREMGRKYGGTFQPARCVRCQTLYLIREEFKEISYGAFRANISAVWKVSEPAA